MKITPVSGQRLIRTRVSLAYSWESLLVYTEWHYIALHMVDRYIVYILYMYLSSQNVVYLKNYIHWLMLVLRRAVKKKLLSGIHSVIFQRIEDPQWRMNILLIFMRGENDDPQAAKRQMGYHFHLSREKYIWYLTFNMEYSVNYLHVCFTKSWFWVSG